MDALSALKMMVSPQVTGAASDLTQAGAAKAIPTAELQSLTGANSDVQNTGAVQPAGSFKDMLGSFVGEVNDKQVAANDAVAGLMSGKNVSLHQAMISVEEASVSFQMMVEVRNKLLDSYQELMRMQV